MAPKCVVAFVGGNTYFLLSGGASGRENAGHSGHPQDQNLWKLIFFVHITVIYEVIHAITKRSPEGENQRSSLGNNDKGKCSLLSSAIPCSLQ